MQFLARAIPPLSIFVVTVLVALPWGMAAENRFLLPLLPLTVIYYWSSRQSAYVPEWVAFASGLSLDILTNAPVGFWAFIYLLAFLAGSVMSRSNFDGWLGRWLGFVVALGVLVAIAWGISSIYHARLDDWRPYVTAGAAAIFFFPLIAALLSGIDLASGPPRQWPAPGV